MRYLQTQQLTTMFCVQRSVSHILFFFGLSVYCVRPMSCLFINGWTSLGLHYDKGTEDFQICFLKNPIFLM